MHSRAHFDWKLRTQSLALGTVTRVMGILNVTPDSFSDGGLFHSVDDAVQAALAMFAEGAAIVDIGGESTRPGASGAISTQQEIDRVLPVIEGIRRTQPGALLSIDSYHAATAQAAIEAGAEIVNDVSGLLWDEAMAATCAHLQCGVILMHARGRPSDWKSLPRLLPEEVVPLVRDELAERRSAALAAGIAQSASFSIPASASAKFTTRTTRYCAASRRLPRSASRYSQVSPAKASSAAPSPRSTAPRARLSRHASMPRSPPPPSPSSWVRHSCASIRYGRQWKRRSSRTQPWPQACDPNVCCPEEAGWLRS